jgi:hypothetical protein
MNNFIAKRYRCCIPLPKASVLNHVAA